MIKRKSAEPTRPPGSSPPLGTGGTGHAPKNRSAPSKPIQLPYSFHKTFRNSLGSSSTPLGSRRRTLFSNQLSAKVIKPREGIQQAQTRYFTPLPFFSSPVGKTFRNFSSRESRALLLINLWSPERPPSVLRPPSFFHPSPPLRFLRKTSPRLLQQVLRS